MNTRAGYSWSPDGKAIAWIRTFPEGHTEVIVRELETGKERQLTFDQKMIDEVCWTPNDQIIFSSTKSGNTNLWMVSANGGQALQITKGSGPDVGMRISTDGKKSIYFQRQEIGRLWLARIDGSSARQITFDERNILNPVFSPDGRRLLFCMGDPDILKPAIHLYGMNRDGGNRQQITSGDQITLYPSWSPDGRWIAYSARSISEPLDSAGVYLVEAANLANPRLLGRGSGRCYWIDSKSFIVFTSSNSWLFAVEGTTPKRISEDSTFALPVFGEKDMLLLDSRKGREGWWMAPMADWRAPATRPLKKILELGSRSRFALAPSREALYYVKNVGELRKMTLPDGKEQRLPGTFPFLRSDFNVSHDDQEIIWVDRRTQGKLVIIENLFK